MDTIDESRRPAILREIPGGMTAKEKLKKYLQVDDLTKAGSWVSFS